MKQNAFLKFRKLGAFVSFCRILKNNPKQMFSEVETPVEIWPFRFLKGVHVFIFFQIANLAVQIFIFFKTQI